MNTISSNRRPWLEESMMFEDPMDREARRLAEPEVVQIFSDATIAEFNIRKADAIRLINEKN